MLEAVQHNDHLNAIRCLPIKPIVQQLVCMIQVIRDLLAPDKYVIVVEHDLSVLDYLSDFICCLYGKPGAYGVVTLPFSVREGINIFLAGFVPTENLRFREEGLTFKVAENAGEGDDDVKKFARYTYPGMSKTQVVNRTMPCMLVCVYMSSAIDWRDCHFYRGQLQSLQLLRKAFTAQCSRWRGFMQLVAITGPWHSV